MKLYPYQEKAVEHAVNALFERKNSLIVAATGAGKTIMLAAAIGRFFNAFYAQHGRKPHTLVLVHRTEIHDQNHTKFSKVVPQIATSEFTADRKSFHGHVHFGMVQTISNALEDFNDVFFDLIVIDEAHHTAAQTYKDIIDWNASKNYAAALLGVTATPNRGDRLPLVDLFDNFYQITFEFLFNAHYLVRPQMQDLSLVFQIIKGKSLKQEKGKLNKNLQDKEPAIKSMIDDYIKHKLDGKTVIFAPSHAFCELVFKELKSRGKKPAYLYPNIDDVTRSDELKRFETGDADELINVDICTEGYDYPELRNLVEFDTNGSHTQWVQKVGRVLRTAPGKTECKVLDFGGNIAMYPDGVETTVNLDGAYKTEGGTRLTNQDFFKKDEEPEKPIIDLIEQKNETFTPYHLPKGFETVNDKDNGIVFVACGKDKDVIITKINEVWVLFVTDKVSLKKVNSADFDTCIKKAMVLIDSDIIVNAEPITRIQISLLAPEYPTATLTKSGANCCICWKTWKDEVLNYG